MQGSASNMSNEFMQTRLEYGRIVQFKMFFLVVVELIAGIFALIPECFFRIGFGRRYFSVMGIGASYCTTLIIYHICSAASSFSRKAESLSKMEISFGARPNPASTVEVVSSPENLFLAMKVFVVIALLQKSLCYARKLIHREPPMATYGGDSIFGFVAAMIPKSLLKHIAFSGDDFTKRYIEPVAVYVFGIFLARFDELAGALFIWCSLALLIRAWSCRIRFQAEIDEMNDIRVHTSHLFDAVDGARNGSADRVTARLS